MKEKIKSTIAGAICILAFLFIAWRLIDIIFIRQLRDIFKDLPLTFENVMVVFTYYLLLFFACWLIYKLLKWAFKNW